MEITSIPRKGITFAEGQDLTARSETIKSEQAANKIENAKQAFRFKLMNQDDVFAQIDLIRNAGNFELGSPNVNRLSDRNGGGQSVAMPEDVSNALTEFANQLAPGLIDDALNSLFNPYHGQEIKDQFVDATSYIRDQLETALSEGNRNGSYGLTYANMQSLKELAFHHGDALSLQKEFSEGTFGNTQAGYQSDLTMHVARAANRQQSILQDNKDNAFTSILKTSSDNVFDQIYTNAEAHLGKDLRATKGFSKLYNDILKNDAPSEGWLVRKQSISIFA
jgi:hypothetical protein